MSWRNPMPSVKPVALSMEIQYFNYDLHCIFKSRFFVKGSCLQEMMLFTFFPLQLKYQRRNSPKTYSIRKMYIFWTVGRRFLSGMVLNFPANFLDFALFVYLLKWLLTDQQDQQLCPSRRIHLKQSVPAFLGFLCNCKLIVVFKIYWFLFFHLYFPIYFF